MFMSLDHRGVCGSRVEARIDQLFARVSRSGGRQGSRAWAWCNRAAVVNLLDVWLLRDGGRVWLRIRYLGVNRSRTCRVEIVSSQEGFSLDYRWTRVSRCTSWRRQSGWPLLQVKTSCNPRVRSSWSLCGVWVSRCRRIRTSPCAGLCATDSRFH